MCVYNYQIKYVLLISHANLSGEIDFAWTLKTMTAMLLTWDRIGLYVCAFLCVCVYVCMYVCMYICMYVCMCVYACMHVCIYACMYVCMYVCMYQNFGKTFGYLTCSSNELFSYSL